MKRDRAFVWNDQNKTIRSGKKIPLFVCLFVCLFRLPFSCFDFSPKYDTVGSWISHKVGSVGFPSRDLRCCPLKRTFHLFGFLHVPNQGKELRPVGRNI